MSALNGYIYIVSALRINAEQRGILGTMLATITPSSHAKDGFSYLKQLVANSI